MQISTQPPCQVLYQAGEGGTAMNERISATINQIQKKLDESESESFSSDDDSDEDEDEIEPIAG